MIKVILLDNDPKINASYLCDEDLKIQPFWLARIVSATMKDNDPAYDFAGYEHIYLNTDIVPKELRRWSSHSKANWEWSKDYFNSMLQEYEQRFQKKHPCHTMLELFDSVDLEGGDDKEKFTPPQYMEDKKYLRDGNNRSEEDFKRVNGKGKWVPSTLMSYREWYNTRSGVYWSTNVVPAFLNINGGVTNAQPVRAR